VIYRFLSAVICCLYAVVLQAAPVTGVGLQLLQLPDPTGPATMKVALFYPAAILTGTTAIGPLDISAQRDAQPQPGSYPLVLISHGSGGSMFSHHDTASALARQGFVVAAIEHPGDNFRDLSGQGSDRVYAGRSVQLSALLDQLQALPQLAELIDLDRIGVLGFSAGGYTALVMAGAMPEFDRLAGFCSSQPGSVLCAGSGQIRRSTPPIQPLLDSRISAAFVIAPIGSALFSPEALRQVPVPVYLYHSAADSQLPQAEHGQYVRKHLSTLKGHTELEKADHFVFIAPCSDRLAASAPAICNDAPGVDRQAIHQQLNQDAVAFFQARL